MKITSRTAHRLPVGFVIVSIMNFPPSFWAVMAVVRIYVHGAVVPLKKLESQIFFHLHDGKAYCGLRNAAYFCGFSEVERFGRPDEIVEALEIHESRGVGLVYYTLDCRHLNARHHAVKHDLFAAYESGALEQGTGAAELRVYGVRYFLAVVGYYHG